MKDTKKAYIIVLAGQSNAVGVGHVKCLPKHFPPERIERWKKGYEDVRINYFSHDKKSGGFTDTATGCTERGKDTIGPELAIAEEMHLRYPERNVFIVKCAFGGTSLERDWRSPSCGGNYDPGAYAERDDFINHIFEVPVPAGWCFNELVKLLRESIDILEKDGYHPVIKAFCWMQGEGDACSKESAEQYIKLYDAMLKDFREAFADNLERCTFVDAGVSDVWPFYYIVNAEKKAYEDRNADCRYFDTLAAGLTTANEPFEQPDIAHYDTDSVIKLGKMFADEILLD